ncbi:hypothetical protein O5O45_06985 [Hahella aquimaris]|uniref:hypothetical protein n=1 Tax=Hahella sp. HNIBRBA332 TaxID=3015983 RepID=UPI00273C2517|nr:hypothetical protein [Hahella sp. HNIBRBA332]WLQ15658.1 hypothetical protein O5O45_06985 [Hahella sp. HNIBRBA332]
MKFTYPLPTHKTGGFYPPTGKCGYCGNSNEGNFVVISQSAMEKIPGTNSYAPADVITSFSLLDHGVTKTGQGITIFENTNDAFFCSTECLRNFLNAIVDDFEAGK